ncbi:MAG TPA: hypothetical protein VNJ71_05775 [Gemmatimonadales bacterium]|nr:hypothetical protein [Gemmatimonadales bacterium]
MAHPRGGGRSNPRPRAIVMDIERTPEVERGDRRLDEFGSGLESRVGSG